jgi:hypothetical protein
MRLANFQKLLRISKRYAAFFGIAYKPTGVSV